MGQHSCGSREGSADVAELLVRLTAHYPVEPFELDVLLEAARMPDLAIGKLVQNRVAKMDPVEVGRIARGRIERHVANHGSKKHKQALERITKA